MTITLGGITLNQHVSWRNRWSMTDVPGSERPTLGGGLVVQRHTPGSELIVLEAIEEDDIRKGYFTQSQLESIRAFRDLGSTITLSYHGESFSVVVKSDGIVVEKTLWQSEFTADERYIGTITLERI